MKANISNRTNALLVLFATLAIYSCTKKADSSGTAPASTSTTGTTMPANSLYFDSLMKNIVVQGDNYNGFWQMGSTAFIKYTGTTQLSLVFRFLTKPIAGKYKAVFRDPKANECYFYVNYLDGANSSTYGASDTGKYVTVSIVGGKVNASMESTKMGGNRGGPERTGWANVTDQ